MSTPILFLDLDGVLNPYRASTPHGDWHKVKAGNLRVWCSPMLGEWLNSLVDNGVHIVWATTWVTEPTALREYVDHMNLNQPELDMIEYDPTWDDTVPKITKSNPHGLLGNCGKLPGIAVWLDSTDIDVGPMVWVDDDIGSEDRKWAVNHNIATLQPHPGAGLRTLQNRNFIVENLLPNS